MRRRSLPIALAAIVLLGLGLRIWSARGGLWLDEAWSAVLVAPIRTPLGIFVDINHDNNHHLNSLWMWLCGFGASPLLLRAPSIATGTLAIPVAAALGARRSAAHMLVAALLFAVSPILVDYGSEARGYAPMLLAAMTMIWCVARALERPAGRHRRTAWLLALLALVGMFSHLTMLFFVVAIAAWVAWSSGRRMPIDAAIGASIRLLLPAFAACLLAIGTVVGAAEWSPTGMQVGDYVPFALADWSGALATMATATLGLSAGGPWIAAILVMPIGVLLLRAIGRHAPMAPLQCIAMLGLPLLFPLLRIGNSGMPRYYLATAIAILLLASDFFGDLLAGRRSRVAAAMALALLTAACLREDIAQGALLRGDPDAAIGAMRWRSPRGAVVSVEDLRPTAVLRVAAASAHYPVAIVGDCPPGRFLYIELGTAAPAPVRASRCGRPYRRLLVRRAPQLSGVDWALYEEADRDSHAP